MSRKEVVGHTDLPIFRYFRQDYYGSFSETKFNFNEIVIDCCKT